MATTQESCAPVTRAGLEEFVRALMAEEIYDKATGVATFADGSPCINCINGAIRIAEAFGGKVYGYWSSANPTAEVGQQDLDGHDFAVIGERWIVDYWVYTTLDLLSSPVLDLHDEADLALAQRLLGDRGAWEIVRA